MEVGRGEGERKGVESVMSLPSFCELVEIWVAKYGGRSVVSDLDDKWFAPCCSWEPDGFRHVTCSGWGYYAVRGDSEDRFMLSDRAVAFAMLVRHSQPLPDGSVLTWERHKPTRWCFWIGPKERVFNVPGRLVPYCVDWAYNGMPAEMLADTLLEILP